MKKKLLLALAISFALVCLFAISISATEIGGIDYTLSGETASVSSTNQTLATGDVVIPATVTYNNTVYKVTSISSNAFYNNTSITSFKFEGEITSIGRQAFKGCTNLSTIEITNTLDTPATVQNDVCDALTSLTSVKLHGISIGACMFRNLTGTEDLTITATNVGSIDGQAFYNADNVVEIYVSGPFSSVNTGSTFRDCEKLKKLTIINTGDTVVNSGNAEVNPSLEDVIIKGKIIVNSPAFQNNAKIKNVHIGDGVTEIGDRAFYKCCALEKVYLADSIKIIGDRAFDMESAGAQTSESFTFVDENGNDDNYLPTSLETINGHFLKRIKIANEELIFPESFTSHTSSQAYDFEGTTYPEGFRLIYLGKMTAVNLATLQKSDVTVYLTKNKSSDIANERVNIFVTETEDGTTITDTNGTYAGQNTAGTLTISLNDGLNNSIDPSNYIKYYFCGSNEICFLTRRNIAKSEGASATWTNLVTMPATYEQLTAAGVEIDKHPIVNAPQFFPATCEEDGGNKSFCVCGALVSIEDVVPATGHLYDNEIGRCYPAVSETNDAPNYYANATCQYFCSQCEKTVEKQDVEGTNLFTRAGYSVSETDPTKVSYIVYANTKLIEKMGESFEYGLVVSAVPDGNPLEYVDGELVADDYTLKIEMSGNSYNKLTVKVSNVTATTLLHCNGYVADGTSVVYLNHKAVEKTATSVTHTDMVTLQNGDQATTTPTEGEEEDTGNEEAVA